MVDTNRLKSHMVLEGFNQRTLTEEFKRRGYKIANNTLNAKLNNKSPWTCDDADMFCEVLKIKDPAEKAKIFLA